MKPAGRVKQNKVGNPGRYSFALHNRGFLRIPCPAVRNRKKKAAYFRVLQPEPSNAVLLYLAFCMSHIIRFLFRTSGKPGYLPLSVSIRYQFFGSFEGRNFALSSYYGRSIPNAGGACKSGKSAISVWLRS
jgi:hypothetical protein